MTQIKRVLISVYDKTAIVDFAKALWELGVEIVATEGTLKVLKEGGIRSVKPISNFTQFPEMLDGRVKTVHPQVLAGILALRNKEEHLGELKRLGMVTIDMVVCNLYPVKEEIGGGADLRNFLDQIDIGGVNLIRAAAKNYEHVVILVNPQRYGQILKELDKGGNISIETRRRLAVEAFKTTAIYDGGISSILARTSPANVVM